MRRSCRIGFVFTAFLLTSCAQVPKESLTLTQTLGRDLMAIQQAHISTINIVFDRLEADVEYFIKNVYTPYQIHEILSSNEIGKEVFDTLSKAAQPDSDASTRNAALMVMAVLVEEIQRDVNDYRQILTAPIQEQRQGVLAQVNSAYFNAHSANAATAGYLASVIQVNDAQNELLTSLGAPRLQYKLSREISAASDNINILSKKASITSKDVDALKAQFQSLTGTFQPNDGVKK